MTKLQIIIGVMVLISFAAIVNMVRKKKIDLRYALSWMGLAAIVLILDVFPNILFILSNLLGVKVPSNMIFLVSLIIVLIMTFFLTRTTSRLSNQIKRLTQENAILREEMENLKKQKDVM